MGLRVIGCFIGVAIATAINIWLFGMETSFALRAGLLICAGVVLDAGCEWWNLRRAARGRA